MDMHELFKDANGNHPALDLLSLRPITPAPGQAVGDMAATHLIPSVIRQGAAVELRAGAELSAVDRAALTHAIFHDDDYDVRRSAIDSLAHLGPLDLVVPVLLACCFGDDPSIVIACLDQLTAISPETVASLSPFLFSKLCPEDVEEVSAAIELAKLKLHTNIIE